MSSVRDAILSKCKRRIKKFEIPGLGEVYIQSLTELERSKCETDSLTNLRASLIAFSLVDKEGTRLFSDKELPTIQSVDSSITGALINAIESHCSINEKADEEEQAKN